MHTRLQLDITAEISIRDGANGTTEIVILDTTSEASTVIELMGKHAEQLRDALIEYTA